MAFTTLKDWKIARRDRPGEAEYIQSSMESVPDAVTMSLLLRLFRHGDLIRVYWYLQDRGGKGHPA
ncbi:MAG: hypothetical protein ACLR17_01870 [Enterobacteriaceae bacterium]